MRVSYFHGMQKKFVSRMKNIKRKIKKFFILFSAVIGVMSLWMYFFLDKRIYSDAESEKRVTFAEDSLNMPFLTRADTVSEALNEKGIRIEEGDMLFPSGDTHVHDGQTIFLSRRIDVVVRVGNEDRKIATTLKTVGGVLHEQGIHLLEHDFVLPGSNIPLSQESEIRIIHVEISHETEYEKIPFPTKTVRDDDLGWRVKKVSQKGEAGKRELVYTVVRHDGKVMKKTLEKKQIALEPVEEIITQGTYVKLGKKHSGLGTWYSFTGTLAAASPWLPMGSYAKVTNTDTGKSVIVKINDRGPFGKNRIIDLDKKAFQEIASIGAGVINVLVEEVLN